MSQCSTHVGDCRSWGGVPLPIPPRWRTHPQSLFSEGGAGPTAPTAQGRVIDREGGGQSFPLCSVPLPRECQASWAWQVENRVPPLPRINRIGRAHLLLPGDPGRVAWVTQQLQRRPRPQKAGRGLEERGGAGAGPPRRVWKLLEVIAVPPSSLLPLGAGKESPCQPRPAPFPQPEPRPAAKP